MIILTKANTPKQLKAKVKVKETDPTGAQAGSSVQPPGSFLQQSHRPFGSPGGTSGKEPGCHCRRRKRCRFDPWVRDDPLEKGTVTHSSILAWRILWTEEPGGLQSMGWRRVE